MWLFPTGNKVVVVANPWGFTVPFKVAELDVTLVAATVADAGALPLGAVVKVTSEP